MWKDVYGFESKYQINENGEIKSKTYRKILSRHYDNRGYVVVGLTRADGSSTTKGVHRLLMETFCPCENMDQLTVNHINHIKDDNRLENLEWMTNADNVKEAFSAGLHIGNHKGGNNKRAVRCIETGEIFESTYAAAKAVNIASYSKIGAAANNQSRTCGGFHWCWAKDTHITLNDTKTYSRKVRCVETNQIYESTSEAARQLGLDSSSISKVLRGIHKTCGNYHWEYVEQ